MCSIRYKCHYIKIGIRQNADIQKHPFYTAKHNLSACKRARFRDTKDAEQTAQLNDRRCVKGNEKLPDIQTYA